MGVALGKLVGEVQLREHQHTRKQLTRPANIKVKDDFLARELCLHQGGL